MSQRTRGLLMVGTGVIILVALAIVLVVSFLQPAPPAVVTAPTNPPMFVTATPGGPTAEPGSRPVASGGFIPNDPQFDRQWYLPAIHAPQYWERMPPNLPQVTVAVIDSGICGQYADLEGRLVAGNDWVNETSYRALVGFAEVTDRPLPDDDRIPPLEDALDHGCAMAAIIAAITDNQLGIAGLAPNAVIMPLKVLDGRGNGTVENTAAAIRYAADNGADIINLSLNLNPGSTDAEIAAITDAVNYAVSKSIPIVASGGNTGGGPVALPASLEAVIAVGSLGPNMQPDPRSAAQGVDVWAPGEEIVAPSIFDENGRRDYKEFGGSSIAAAVVTGVLAATGRVPTTTVNGLPVLDMAAGS
jgi:subtilisin family serine protease